MKLIKPSFEILQQENSFSKGAKIQIEKAGRTCYKSEAKITENSYEDFFNMIKHKGHLSVLEHGTLYFKIQIGTPLEDDEYIAKSDLVRFFRNNHYSRAIKNKEPIFDSNGKILSSYSVWYITTNYRVVEENFEQDKKDYLFEFLSLQEPLHDKRISVRFICSRSISLELVRHRVFSFSQESQRYCNYSKSKFNNEITFIEPEYMTPKLKELLKQTEDAYFYLIGLHQTPEQAREVLPNSTKTEIVMTGYEDDWKQFLELRTSNVAHPEMRRLTIPLQKEIFK